MIKIPSVKTLETRLGINALEAKRLRKMLAQANEGISVRTVLSEVSDFLGFCGVEYLLAESENGNPIFAYANSGETYQKTVIYHPEQERFIVCSWGDFVEFNPQYRFL